MKKIASLFLAIVLAAGVLTATPLQLPGLVVSASAEETTVPEGTTGAPEDTTVPEDTTNDSGVPAEKHLEFKLNLDGISYAVSGYTGTSGDVIIPTEHEGKPVTAIAPGAFRDSKIISSITIPGSVLIIDEYAFKGSSIEQVYLEDGLETIHFASFQYCSSLKKIILPNTLKTINGYAFDGCTSLEEIIIPGSVSTISYGAFRNCSKLKSLTFLDGANGVDSTAFTGCTEIEKIDLPETHVKLAAAFFKDSKIYKDKSNWYGDSFYIDNQLINTTWYIHGARTVRPGTTHINPSAFATTKNLIAITIPASVKYIGDNALNGESLSIIYYEGTESQFKQIDFGNNTTRLENMAVVCGINKNNIPKTPKIKSLVNVAGGVQITWNKVANADLYAVYRRGSGTNRWTLLGVTTETAVIDTSAGHRQYWRYSVQALNDDGASNLDFTGKYIKYVATPKLTGISNSTNGIYFKWKEVSGASGYRVYRRGAGGSWKYLTTVTGTSYTDKAVKNDSGKYYRYTVRAVVDGRYSGYEDFLYIKRLATPKVKSVTYKGNNKAEIKWNPVAGANGYYVYRYDSSPQVNQWKCIGYVKGANASSFVDKNGVYFPYYEYTVRAASGKTLSYYNKGIKQK